MESENVWSESLEKAPEANEIRLHTLSLDYLAGDSTVLVKDKKLIYRLEVLEKVNPTYKDRILYMLDLMLKDAQSNSLSEKLA